VRRRRRRETALAAAGQWIFLLLLLFILIKAHALDATGRRAGWPLIFYTRRMVSLA
jgi:hypothetical protein